MTTESALQEIFKGFNSDTVSDFFQSLEVNTLRLIKEDYDFELDTSQFETPFLFGEINLKNEDLLAIFTIKVENNLTERSGKKAQYDLAKKVLKWDRHYSAGIFIFYDDKNNFRFSLVYGIPEPTGQRNYSSFRRYTYFVSRDQSNKTFLLQIQQADFSSLERLKEAFSVEKVTKAFYAELQNWYFWAMDRVVFPDDYKYSPDPDKDKEIRNATSLIRLITRIIFIWFLKEKELVPKDLFSKEKLNNIVKEFYKTENSSNFYNAILQNLFFATLNQKMNERKFAENNGFSANKKEYGIKNLYRYEDKFLISKDEVVRLFENIPFLNGGLFDCLDKEDEQGKVIYVDGFSRNPAKSSTIPDNLFFQEKEETVNLTKYYDSVSDKTVRGLFEILNNYNFTIDENTPIDQEVALDPELLGKVFENLLASYNPETATTARKATGSYYTPREIVDYMVGESLLEYLKTILDISDDTNTVLAGEEVENNIDNPDTPDTRLRKLLSYSEEKPTFSEIERQKIISAIDNIKIIDPACGSGAFPMGILHKLVSILQKLDPENKDWYNHQYQKAIKDTEEVFKHDNKEQREERLKEINEIFDESINYPDYARKLYLIENCIYGVDIQPIAIQISKLRFFISLVLDQKVDKNKDNFGIRALPNLETRFVAANTLIGLEKPEHIFYTDKIKNLEEEIKTLRHKYFQAKTRKEKLNYQNKDKELREKLAEALREIGFPPHASDKIAEFDLYDQNTHADFFDPEWMFGVNHGFDIVIGNPPYISTKGISEEEKKILMKHFGFADDIYNHFYFKGMQLLKENGILTFISSKTFWTIQTKKNLRELILKNQLLQLFDTVNPFDAPMVDTCVILVQKKSNPFENYTFKYLDGKKSIESPAVQEGDIECYKNAPNQAFFPITDYNLKIYKRYGKKVNELLNQWWDKISTSRNIEKYKVELENYRNSLKPGDITLLGLITDGGVGLQTGNNGKYIGVLENTKWAENVKKQRPEKLLMATHFCKQQDIKNKTDASNFLNNLTEQEIRKLFDGLKEKYGRDIFGQGWLYRIVRPDEIADIEKITEDEKLNGINGEKTFVPYDKGDKEGNRWYAPTPYYINWNKENVKFLKENSGKKAEGMPVIRNPQFYFREGFCWNNVLSDEKIKCRIKEKSIHSTEAMTFFTLEEKILPNYYLICIMNSTFFGYYRMLFINTSHHLTTGNAKEYPIIVPTFEQLKFFDRIFNQAVSIQKQKFAGIISEQEAEKKLNEIQNELDPFVEQMYLC